MTVNGKGGEQQEKRRRWRGEEEVRQNLRGRNLPTEVNVMPKQVALAGEDQLMNSIISSARL